MAFQNNFKPSLERKKSSEVKPFTPTNNVTFGLRSGFSKIKNLFLGSKAQNNKISYITIGEYQFANLMVNPVKFLMLDLRDKNQNPELKKSQMVKLEEVLDAANKNLPEKDYSIIVICQDGKKSKKAAEKLVKAGYINVVLLEGGIQSLKSFDFKNNLL